MPDIVVFGVALIDLFAEPSKSLADTAMLRPSPGGAPANVAVTLRRLEWLHHQTIRATRGSKNKLTQPRVQCFMQLQ